jgi:hypothetical protein
LLARTGRKIDRNDDFLAAGVAKVSRFVSQNLVPCIGRASTVARVSLAQRF